MKDQPSKTRSVPRVTITMDDRGGILGIRSDEDTEILIVDPHAMRDKVYRWTSTNVGPDRVDERLDECIVHRGAPEPHRPN